jgi:hypothetical protein
VYTFAGPKVPHDVDKEDQVEESSLAILSKALEKLKEPPPTRLNKNPQQTRDESKTKPILLLERVEILTESDDDPAGRQGSSADEVRGEVPSSTKPFPLVSRVQISSTADSCHDQADTAVDSEPAAGKPFELVERASILSGLHSICECFIKSNTA